MATYEEGRFVRFPTELLEALIGARLSGTQFRILLWVVRGTYGWNRRSIPFTWYRIAKELFLDRPVTYRAGKTLLQTGVLLQEDHQLSIQNDSRKWDAIVLSPRNDNARQLWMPEITVAWEQRQALSGNNVTVAGRQRNRCQETTLFRRVKDRCKDNLKTYKDRHSHRRRAQPPLGRGEKHETQPLASAAKPIPGKYDRLSKN